MRGSLKRLPRTLASWRVTITVRPLFVIALIAADVTLRFSASLLDRAITHHPEILQLLDMALGVTLFLAVLLLAVCAVNPPGRRSGSDR